MTTASSGIEGSHSATLSRTVPSKRKTSWSTKETEAASALREMSSSRCPSMRIAPSHGL